MSSLDLSPYLAATDIINWQQPNVLAKAHELAAAIDTGCDQGELEIARNCFEFVRDEIKHSWDYQLNPVTLTASDVLHYGTGYCYAKSHLLAALLRANQIPAGLCYQRLTISNDSPPFCLHGLNAVFLKEYGWYRIDARGNKPGVDARFCPPHEQLAYPIVSQGEADLPEVWAEPLPVVSRALATHSDYLALSRNLPDIELIKL